MKSSAFSHAIVALADVVCPEWARRTNAVREGCTNGLRCPGVREVTREFMGKPLTYRVGADATHYATYRYVTGRHGRITRRDLFLCDPCAAAFARKHLTAQKPSLDATGTAGAQPPSENTHG
jgi:hypothetical protein